MFSLIQKILSRARSFDQLYDRIEKIETQIKRFEKLADENESLWQFLDEQKEIDSLFAGSMEDILSAEEFQEDITDMMLRNMKPHGDA